MSHTEPQQPGAQQPATPSQPSPQPRNRPGLTVLGLTGFIIAIVSLLLSLIPIVNNASFFFGVVAIVFTVIGIIATRAGRKRGRGLSVAGLIVAILSIVAVLASQAFYSAALDHASKGIDQVAASASREASKADGSATDQLLGKEVTVDLGTFTATQDAYGTSTTALPVHVVNKAAAKHTYMIEIESVDAAGTRLDDDTVMVNDLAAGQAQDLTAFQYIDSSKVDAVKGGQFKIVKVSQL